VLKGSPANEVLYAVEVVAQGQNLLGRDVHELMLRLAIREGMISAHEV
jgi:hypothetical protein